MNSNLALPSLVVAVILSLNSPGVMAQGARYQFPPNIWLKERNPAPKSLQDRELQRASAVSPDFLGLNSLCQREPIPVQDKTIVVFNPKFGKAVEPPLLINPSVMPGHKLPLRTSWQKNLADVRPTVRKAKEPVAASQTCIRSVAARMPRKTSEKSRSHSRPELATYTYNTGYVPAEQMPLKPGNQLFTICRSAVRGRILTSASRHSN